MKKEVPPFVIAIIAVVAVAAIAGVWFLSGGTGQMSPAEQDLAEKQTKVQTERFDQNLGGGAGSEEQARGQ
ncbi:MAG: hypothetical protein KF884_01700 [Fimbriimonadaceae bacterium]|nr:hypothetical protein [Fimbriimonadaceae bacterium]QYK58809.1 MAG: hypothetical protein KF884_01700 [Fimbriimonadaceae bacterium]